MKYLLFILIFFFPVCLFSQSDVAQDSVNFIQAELGETARADLLELLQQRAFLDEQIKKLTTIIAEQEGVKYPEWVWRVDEDLKNIYFVRTKAKKDDN